MFFKDGTPPPQKVLATGLGELSLGVVGGGGGYSRGGG